MITTTDAEKFAAHDALVASAGDKRTKLDPTSFAVIYNALNAVVKEMSLTFEYSAWSSIIAEARDFSCAVYDAGSPPNALCVLDGLPIHVNAQPVAISEIAKFFGSEEINDGDVMLVNSAYYGNTHIGDFVIATPVFYEGEHLFWSAATGHHMDVGSAYRTSVPVYATDIWSEGLQISPLKIADRGVVRRDVMNMLLENVRYRDFIYGDLMSQIGSVKTGKKRLLEMLDEWDADTLRTFSSEIIDYADRRTREELASWPNGTYSGEAWVDSDGYGREHITVRCQMTIEGDQVKVDFDGSDPQGRGGINAGWATCRNSVSTAILMCIDPDIPHNEGCLQHIEVSAPKGTVVNAEWPAPTAAATIVPADTITDAVWKCLAQAIPEKAVAGCGHVTPNCVTTGIDRRDPEVEKPFGVILFNGSSGGGASAVCDGWPFMVTPGTVGGLCFAPIEIIEMHFPLVVREYQVRTDSMGAGRHSGGPGLNFILTPRGTGQIDNYGYGDGMTNPPFGLYGGLPGDGGALYRENADGTKFVVSALSYFRVSEGELWCAVATGGGGYGDPLERDPTRVAADARDEFISLETATEIYGVVFTKGFVPDLEATQQRRALLRRDRNLAPINPSVPGAATYYRSLVGPHDTYELNPRPPEDADATL